MLHSRWRWIYTRRTLVWQGTEFAVLFSVRLQNKLYLGDGGTDRREILHHGTYRTG